MSKQSKMFSALIGTIVFAGSAFSLSASAAQSGEEQFYVEVAGTPPAPSAPLPLDLLGALPSGEIPFYYEVAGKQPGASRSVVAVPGSLAVGAATPGEVPYYFEIARMASNQAKAANRGHVM
jgi:hypothetical protein